MKQITLIVGLPGSGKTHLINSHYYDNDNYLIIDDYKSKSMFDNSTFTFSRNYPSLITEIKQGNKNIVISDIDFCKFSSFSEAKSIIDWWINYYQNSYELELKIFEKNMQVCKNNVIKSKDRNVEARLNMINKYIDDYNPAKYLCDKEKIIKIFEL